jgi:large subunit ribosomal protein L10
VQKADKERIVSELTDRLQGTESLIVADYRGLSNSELADLRTKLLEHGARFRVVKNTLTRRAAEAAGVEDLLVLLDGPTAIAFVEADGDTVAVAKALADSAAQTKVLTVRGGIMAGKPISDAEIETLAKLPPLDVLKGQLVGVIVAPIRALAALLAAPLNDLVGLIDARIAQLEERGDTSAAGVAPPEPPLEERDGAGEADTQDEAPQAAAEDEEAEREEADAQAEGGEPAIPETDPNEEE